MNGTDEGRVDSPGDRSDGSGDRTEHRPDSSDGDRTGSHQTGSDDDPSGEPGVVHPDAVDREFDWRGWLLVAAIFVAFLVVPGLIYLYPRVPSNFGLTFWDAYLVLPMIPAVILGLLAVWATTRP